MVICAEGLNSPFYRLFLGELNVKTREDLAIKFFCWAQLMVPIAYCLCPP